MLSGSDGLGILEKLAMAEVRSSIVVAASCRLDVRGDSGREASRLSVVVVMMLDWESCGLSGWDG